MLLVAHSVYSFSVWLCPINFLQDSLLIKISCQGFPLRGTIKDAGILCSCSFCKGVRVGANFEVLFNAAKSDIFAFCMLYLSLDARIIFLNLSR